jgi:hypothetical protein
MAGMSRARQVTWSSPNVRSVTTALDGHLTGLLVAG